MHKLKLKLNSILVVESAAVEVALIFNLITDVTEAVQVQSAVEAGVDVEVVVSAEDWVVELVTHAVLVVASDVVLAEDLAITVDLA